MKKKHWIVPLTLAGVSIQLINNYLFKEGREKLQNRGRQFHPFHWKFGTVHYQRIGSGTPILLVHDTFTGASSVEFEQIIQQLSKKHEVFSIDLLGYGFSEKVNITYTGYLYVQLIHDFITQVIQEKQVDVITSGNSHVFALFASYQSTDLIRKCIMINPPDLDSTMMTPSKRNYTLKYLFELPYIGTTLYNIVHSRFMFNRMLRLNNKTNLSSYIEEFYYNAHNDDSRIRYAFASNLCNYLNLDLRNILNKLDNSLYIINGHKQEEHARFIENQYTFTNPSIECATIKNTSNFPHIENPYATFETIELFLHE